MNMVEVSLLLGRENMLFAIFGCQGKVIQEYLDDNQVRGE